MRTDTAKRTRHVPALDGLRGIAVLLVLGFHLPFGRSPLAEGRFRGGFLGVDLFFVLSGFLITTLLLGYDGLTRDSLRDFYDRRVRRLLPALAVVAAGCLAVALSIQEGAELRATLSSIAAALGYWSNFVQASSIEPKTTILAHTWSLSLEFQYYLIWPVIVLALRRWLAPLALLLLTVIGVQAIAVWRAVLSMDGASFDRVYFAPDVRFDALLVGSALAFFVAWKPRARSATVRLGADAAGIVAFAGIVFLAMNVELESIGLYEQGGLTGVALLAALVVHAVVVDPEGVCASAMRIRPLVALGKISYSLYLWHWPVIFATAPVESAWSFPVVSAVRIAVSFAFAIFSYLLVERLTRRPPEEVPVRGRARNLQPALVVAGAR